MKKIAIHSVPRSGSSWLGQIFNSSEQVNFNFQPLFSYAFKDALNKNSSSIEIDNFFNNIANSNDSFLSQKDKVDSGIYPKFQKNNLYTHVVYKEVRYHNILKNLLEKDSEIKVIGLVRSPFAVINSFLQSPREFRKDLGWNELDEWQYSNKKNLGKKEEFYGYEKWKEVVLLFNELKDKYPDRFCLVEYIDLLNNTEAEIKKIFDFCNIGISKQTLEFINKSQTLNKEDTYSVYRKKENDDSWIGKLKQQIIKEINTDLEISSLEKYKSEY